MNDTDREKWKRVATRIGKWKPDERCLDMNCDHYATPHSYHSAPHDIPCPDPSDPTMIAAMLEWLIAHGITCCVGPRWLILHDQHSTNLADTEMSGKTIAIALIDAIDALPQEVRN